MYQNLPKIISCSTQINSNHVPSINLCRFFKKQSYADDFNRGIFRFGNLKQYRKAELDNRSDPTESESINTLPDGSTSGSFSSGNYYILCFSELNQKTKTSTLAEKFGSKEAPATCVKIENNIALTQRILSAWENSNEKNRIAYFQWFKVIYNKNEEINTFEIDNDLHIYQKPKEHKVYRLKRLKIEPCPPQCIDLGGDIGSITKFSSLNPLDMIDYNSRLQNSCNEWEILDPIVNNFETEQEWRLVFYSGHGHNNKTGMPCYPINSDDFFLSSKF